jgi:CRISPR-associated protein Csm1
LCPVCGNPTKYGLCFDCNEHEKLGGAVANAKYLIKYVSQSKITEGLYFDKLNIGYLFKKSKQDIISIINENALNR